MRIEKASEARVAVKGFIFDERECFSSTEMCKCCVCEVVNESVPSNTRGCY